MSLQHERHLPPEIPDEKDLYFMTAQGSKYYLLPDGRTQRYKEMSAKGQEWHHPCSIIVFIPNYEDLLAVKPTTMSVDTFKKLFGGNDEAFSQILRTTLAFSSTNVVDEKGKILRTNAERDSAQQIFLRFEDRDGLVEPLFVLVGKTPQIGYRTFDKDWQEVNGQIQSFRHLGNNIVELGPKAKQS